MHTHILGQGSLLEFKLCYQAGFERFFSGHRGTRQKNFIIRAQGSKAQDKNNKNNIISNRTEESGLIIDCYQGFCHFIVLPQYSQMSCVVEVTERPNC